MRRQCFEFKPTTLWTWSTEMQTLKPFSIWSLLLTSIETLASSPGRVLSGRQKSGSTAEQSEDLERSLSASLLALASAPTRLFKGLSSLFNDGQESTSMERYSSLARHSQFNLLGNNRILLLRHDRRSSHPWNSKCRVRAC